MLGAIALNFDGIFFNRAARAALVFELFGELLQGFGFGLKSRNDGDGFAFASFAGGLHSQILLGWGDFRDRSFYRCGVGVRAKFSVGDSLVGAIAVGGLALRSGHKGRWLGRAGFCLGFIASSLKIAEEGRDWEYLAPRRVDISRDFNICSVFANTAGRL